MKVPKLTMLVTSLVILLPIVAGILLWNQLPDLIPTHFGMNNEPNGWSSKPFAVFGIPLIMLALQWVCLVAFRTDPKKKNIHPTVLGLVLWIIPICSLLVGSLCYLFALGREINVGFFVNLLLGVLFVIIGNYLPKCRQTYTIGIRIPWTLNDEDNWNYTHRLGGWVWTAAGLLVILLAFLGWMAAILPVIVLMVLIPCVASYLFYRRKNAG